MRILLLTAGSRGDVEPFVGLARHAQSAGHSVRLALPDRSGADVVGLDTVSLGADFSAMIEDQGVSALAAMRTFRTRVKPIMRAVIVNAVRVALDYNPDVILFHPKVLSAPIAAARLGIPYLVVELVPALTPTSTFPAPGTVTANLGPLNRLTYAAVRASASMFGAELTEARELAGGVSRRERMPSPSATLIPISPLILHQPPDWPATVHLTGAWTGSTAIAAADTELAEFVTAGEFVYAGFGSMASGDAEARGQVIAEAVRARGSRLLVATGLGGIAISDRVAGDDILVRPSVDHAQVLPQAFAAIHHGGIGTVHAAARAGITSIVVPFLADQPFWGAQLHRNGMTPRPIPQRALAATRLATALEEVPSYVERNREVGRAMASEDGLGVALSLIEGVVRDR